jgi:hypothetical protein
VPATVQSVLVARIDREREKQVLQTASMIGQSSPNQYSGASPTSARQTCPGFSTL